MEKILISACLIGDFTRYDGGNNYLPIVEKLKEKYDLIPFCPEIMGGLSIPRDPCEIRGSEVVTKDGVSKTKEYNLGARKALEACKLFGARIAILKESSPSCGVRNIHDGHFNQTKIPGKGITTRLLEENGIACYSSVDDLTFLIEDPYKKEGKEYVSYEERDYDLRHRRFGKKKPFDSTRKKAVAKSEKPAENENTAEASETPAEEKKTFNKPYNSSFKKKSNFHHDGKRSFHHDDRKDFHHNDKFKKREDGERKSYFKKDENGENKKPYFKKDGAHKSFGHGGKGSFKKSFHGKSSYSKGPKRYGKSSSYKGNKDKESA